MDYVAFGRTGIRVSKLCLGAMTFGKEADEQTSTAIMHRAWEIGINFFDTADLYSKGRSEEIVGRWLAGKRKAIVLASKVHCPMGEGPNDWGSSRRNILLAVEQSLKRLKTDWLDVLYLHLWDDQAVLDQSLAAMNTLVEQGKVMYCGVSNFAAWQTMKAVAITEAKCLAPLVCIQPMYNLVKRQVEVEILPLARSEQLAVCPYSPLAAGLLTGKYRRGQTGRLDENAMYRERFKHPQYMEVANRFVSYAASLGMSPAALALAWVSSHPAVTSTIIGARDVAQLNDNLGCLDIHLSPEERAKITALSIDPPSATER
jgi:aryl-alcohol dehydrogenase-like predicted oxidoreductase